MRKWLYRLADLLNENRRLRARVTQLLQANNAEVERRRSAEKRWELSNFDDQELGKLALTIPELRRAVLQYLATKR